MKILTGFTAQPDQTVIHRLETGENIRVRVTFRARAAMWFVKVTYGDLIINGMRVSNFPNILRQFRNNIPFGLAVIIEDESEPLLINDFETGRVRIGVLNAEDVEEIETAINTNVDGAC